MGCKAVFNIPTNTKDLYIQRPNFTTTLPTLEDIKSQWEIAKVFSAVWKCIYRSNKKENPQISMRWQIMIAPFSKEV